MYRLASHARTILFALLVASCATKPVDYTGKTCSPGDCPSGFACDAEFKTCQKVVAPTKPTLEVASAVSAATPGRRASAAPQPGIAFNWSIAGGRFDSGNITESGRTVSFTAGDGPTVTLTCTATNADGAAASNQVTTSVVDLEAPPTITAPAKVVANTTGLVASVDQPDSAMTYAWTISGGQFDGGATVAQGNEVHFSAGSGPAVDVQCATLNSLGDPGPAARARVFVYTSGVVVTAPPRATAGKGGYKASVATQAGASYLWSLEGDGASVDEGQGSAFIEFTASAAPGTLAVLVDVTDPSSNVSHGVAQVSVIAAPSAPVIVAPTFAPIGVAQTATLATAQADMTYLWAVTGAGTLGSSPSASSATFTANARGLLGLRLTATNANGDTATASVDIPAGQGTDWAQIELGQETTCGVRFDQSLWCFGRNDDGQVGDGTTAPRTTPYKLGPPSEWASVATGAGHTCGLRSDSSLHCWGLNDSGQLGDGTGQSRFIPVKVGSDATRWSSLSASAKTTCAIKSEGTLWCWGLNGSGQLGLGSTTNLSAPAQVGASSTWSQVSVGDSHVCAAQNDGSLWCWGYNYSGQIGNGEKTVDACSFFCGIIPWPGCDTCKRTFQDTKAPLRVGTDTDWRRVAAGGGASCATKRDGSLWCWGDLRVTPTRVGVDSDWTEVAVGGSHTCAQKADGSLWCWGTNTSGQLGLGNLASAAAPLKLASTNVARVGLGSSHSCAINRQGGLSCWGLNQFGQLGIGQLGQKTAPTQVGSAAVWAEARVGLGAHACARRTDGTLWCSGRNESGQLGQSGNSADSQDFVQVVNESGWAQVSLSFASSFALKANGELWDWGSFDSGVLGTGATVNVLIPTRVGKTWSAVRPGTTHACGIETTGALFCWGEDSFGQVGVGSTSDAYPTAQRVGDLTDWVAVGLGDRFSCAIRAGRLFCWGHNANGQAGVGSTDTSEYDAPVPVGAGSTWVSLSAGTGHACALNSSAELHCWGANSNGQVGNGATADALSPTLTGSSYQSVSCGASHTCAVSTAGSIYCWGANPNGQLGIGSTAQLTTPARVGSSPDWSMVSAGARDTCAVKKDNTLWCWGANLNGEHGDGTAWRSSPTAVIVN